MKSFKIKYLILVVFIFVIVSCDPYDFLEEEPRDFYSPEISFVSYDDFEAAVYNLHSRFRQEFYDRTGVNQAPRVFHHGTDFAVSQQGLGTNPNYSSFTVPTSNHIYDSIWRPAYRIIFDANAIIARAEDERSQLNESQISEMQAEARFFRGYAYKMLANLYGGVPIELEEVKEPKRDYTRATRVEVYQQAADDLIFAFENLPDIDQTSGARINRLAASHVLAEVYISLEKWDEAISSATEVIEHPSTALMTERFGTRVNEPDLGGDVFWDLFRQGNQNRINGNTEAIWVQQWAFNTPGGGPGGPRWIRFFVPRLWQASIENNDGQSVPIVPSPNTYWHGRGGGFMRQTNHFYYTIWEESGWDEDMRNSEHNMIRDIQVNNPSSDYNGQWVIADNLPIALEAATDTLRDWFPAISGKTTDPGNHPREMWLNDEGFLPSSPEAFVTYRDEYTIRLSETYLLRAEAYFRNNDNINAANDINIVRSRAQAPPVDPTDVDIDYILDERLRELHVEEFRLLTLTRLGKLVERAGRYNTLGGDTWMDHNNLWPIPFSEIEKNILGNLEQNPGY